MAVRRALVFATSALDPLASLTQRAEAAGIDRVWTTEYLQRDAVVRALHIALATSTIEVGTGITYAFTRRPRALAATAADVRRLSGGRFALGLGTGSKGVRRWYGAAEAFDPPAPALAEYTQTLRSEFAKIEELADVGAPPVYGAGLMPVMTRIAVRATDGVLLHPLALVRTHLFDRLVPAIEKGAADRESPHFAAMWVITSIADDEEEARFRARKQIAFYLSTPSYAGCLEGTAWEKVATKVREGFEESKRTATWGELATHVPESLVDEIALVGTPARIREHAARLETELEGAGFDELVFQTVGADLDEDEVAANCARIADALSVR